jgi:predicted transcriptional regulator
MLTPQQCRMARAALELGVRDLAQIADVSPNTIARLEAGEKMHRRTLDFVKGVLETEGIVFINSEEKSIYGGPGIRIGPGPRAFSD